MSDDMGRREFLGAVALAGAAAAAMQTSLIDPAQAATTPSEGITSASASELAEAIRSKKLSSKAIVEAHLDRIAAVNPKLNAIVQLTAESARKEADEADAALARGEIKGPLHGVPSPSRIPWRQQASSARAAPRAAPISFPRPTPPPLRGCAMRAPSCS